MTFPIQGRDGSTAGTAIWVGQELVINHLCDDLNFGCAALVDGGAWSGILSEIGQTLSF
jgi:hypothetical protein